MAKNIKKSSTKLVAKKKIAVPRTTAQLKPSSDNTGHIHFHLTPLIITVIYTFIKRPEPVHTVFLFHAPPPPTYMFIFKLFLTAVPLC